MKDILRSRELGFAVVTAMLALGSVACTASKSPQHSENNSETHGTSEPVRFLKDNPEGITTDVNGKRVLRPVLQVGKGEEADFFNLSCENPETLDFSSNLDQMLLTSTSRRAARICHDEKITLTDAPALKAEFAVVR